jgi:hypothetical protein
MYQISYILIVTKIKNKDKLYPISSINVIDNSEVRIGVQYMSFFLFFFVAIYSNVELFKSMNYMHALLRTSRVQINYPTINVLV